jgi:hypothetical protein
MEPSGRSQWQSVANATGTKAAPTSENHRLRPVAAEMIKEGVERFESVRGICKSPANHGFLYKSSCRRAGLGLASPDAL